jgi:hypothetical protein
MMGAYVPEVIMDAQRLMGFEKDGSPIYVENVSAKSFVGYEKDGTPVFVSTATPTNPVNLLGTVAFIAAGAALGWLLCGATVDYLKK